MKQLNIIQESNNYGTYLREAEEHLLKIEKNCLPTLNDEIIQMRNQYHDAFQRMPSGPSALTQLDIDSLKRLDLVPHGVICQNDQGKNSSSLQSVLIS